MRYYLYISTSKIDMLAPQISSGNKKKISFEFGFDVKILNSLFKTEKSIEDNTIKKLNLIENYLYQNNYVGDLSSDRPWIKINAINARLCSFADFDLGVLYICDELDNTIIAIGGSPEHLIGKVQQPLQRFHATSLLAGIAYSLENFLVTGDSTMKTNSKVFKSIDGANYYGKLLSSIYSIGGLQNQKISFLAKILKKVDYDNKTYLIATPLFISLDD